MKQTTTTATTPKTTRAKVQAAFRELRRFGYAARMNFSCCGTCGSYELHEVMKEKRLKGLVFWNRQTNDAWKGDELASSLWLAWDGDGEDICAILHRHGVTTKWDGKDSRCIEIPATIQ